MATSRMDILIGSAAADLHVHQRMDEVVGKERNAGVDSLVNYGISSDLNPYLGKSRRA